MANSMLLPKCLDKTKTKLLAPDADMSVPRSEFAVGVIGKFIYAVAGRTRDETFYSTERYDITNDKWEFVDPYPVNKYGHEGTVLNNKLFITGESPHRSTSKQVCVFDPAKKGP